MRSRFFAVIKTVAVLAAVLTFSFVSYAATDEYTNALNGAAEILKTELSETVTTYDYNGNEIPNYWGVYALAKSGKITNDIKTRFKEYIESYLTVNDNLNSNEMSKIIITLESIGADTHNFNGRNLLEQYENEDWIMNGYSAYSICSAPYALVAMKTAGASKTEFASSSDALMEFILDYQNEDGSFGYGEVYGYAADLDATGMVLEGLAAYRGDKFSDEVKDAKKAAKDFLSLLSPAESGLYEAWDSENSATTATLIIGLVSAGYNPDNVLAKSPDGQKPIKGIIDSYIGASLFDNGDFDYQCLRALLAYKKYYTDPTIPVTRRNTSSGSGSARTNPNAEIEAAVCIDSSTAVAGDWIKNPETGKWNFLIDGQLVKGRRAAAKNSYANNKAAWFLFDNNGDMLTGWQQYAGADRISRWYYLNPVSNGWLGACYLNTTTPDGYEVDANGAWIEPANDPDVLGDASSVDGIVGDDSTDVKSETNTKTEQETEKEENKITISISIDGSLGDANGNHSFTADGEVEVKKNASAYDALKAFAKKKGWSVNGSSSYVSGINGLKEKSNGPLSGWIYSVNGETPGKSIGSYKLSDGDSVELEFVESPIF